MSVHSMTYTTSGRFPFVTELQPTAFFNDQWLIDQSLVISTTTAHVDYGVA